MINLRYIVQPRAPIAYWLRRNENKLWLWVCKFEFDMLNSLDILIVMEDFVTPV